VKLDAPKKPSLAIQGPGRTTDEGDEDGDEDEEEEDGRDRGAM